MFDHVGMRASDLGVSEPFYRTVLAALDIEASYASPELVEWEDLALGPPDSGHPTVTRGLHLGFRAPEATAVDAFWRAGADGDRPDDGAPQVRSLDGVEQYSARLLDPDGNRVEAVHRNREPPAGVGWIDYVCLRVRDPSVSQRFYATIAPHAGVRLTRDTPAHVQFAGDGFSLSLVRDGRPLSEDIHLAFPADTNHPVRAFHAAAVAAGYADNGAPGERAVYHPGYYAAFVLDPDGHNIEVVNHNG